MATDLSELRESEARYKALVEAVPDIVYSYSDRRGTLFHNNRIYTLLGYQQDTYRREPFLWNLAIHPDDRERVEALAAEHRRLGTTYEVQYRVRHQDGRYLTVLDRVHSMERHDDETIVTGLVSDITENQKLEDRLRQAQKLESLGILAGGIAHDFNNLLAGLLGHLDLAQIQLAGGQVDKATARLAKTRGLFDRARALTRQLLTFSKGGTPQRRLQSLKAPLRDWVDFAMSGSDLSVTLEIEDDLWPCECDSQQIGQVIDNLLINARQASPDGSHLTVRASNQALGQPFIRIAVSDQGTGIPPDVLAKIFDPFFTTKPTGTGLGLSTCFSIARQHEGWIEVETVVGQGSTFTLTLPALPGESPVRPDTDVAPFTGHGLALVLDDEEALRETVGAMLENLGYRVETFADGNKVLERLALAWAENEDVALVLLDMTVPGGNGGLDTARQLKTIGYQGLVFVMSGYWDEVSEAEQQDLNLAGRLSKPFSIQDLTRLLSTRGGYL